MTIVQPLTRFNEQTCIDKFRLTIKLATQRGILAAAPDGDPIFNSRYFSFAHALKVQRYYANPGKFSCPLDRYETEHPPAWWRSVYDLFEEIWGFRI